jgi:alpha-galactosidase
LQPNSKFHDIKQLIDYVHSKGLKFGIYNSPGPLSCAGYIGTYGHETQDAQTFAAWGVDLLKYDYCSAGDLYASPAEMQAVYQKMGAALQATGRPIVYSLSQYGMFDVGTWGRKVGGNLWRTGGDSIEGNRWGSLSERFEADGKPQDNGPGGWNDPDMMLIGNGGMTNDESRTNMTLWSILAAPLIIGNDVRRMTPDVRDILMNKEIIAVDQDRLGKQGRRIVKDGTSEVWIRPLSDGSTAVAIFNRGGDGVRVDVKWSALGLADEERVRDLWKHSDVGDLAGGYKTTVVSHGSVFLRATAIHR